MGAAREKDQADFDLERFVELFDQALTSTDERVTNALRSLMMMVVLTAPETRGQHIGPFKRMVDDHHDMIRKLSNLEGELTQLRHELRDRDPYYKKWLDQREADWYKTVPYKWNTDEYSFRKQDLTDLLNQNLTTAYKKNTP